MRIRSAHLIATAGFVLALAPSLAAAQNATPDAKSADDPMILYARDNTIVRAHFQIGVNAVYERNLFWNYSDVVAPNSGFNPDTEWLEGYFKPGVSVSRRLDNGLTAYGAVSIIASATQGIDAFAAEDQGAITLEEGYVGLRTTSQDGDRSFDISVGPREFKAGTGMLISNGGSNGFTRGALKLGPHKAWDFAGLARYTSGDLSGTAFYIGPNEAQDNNSHTRIAGLDLRYDPDAETYAGMTVGKVLSSDAPYPKAAPNGIGVPSILEGARGGLQFLTLYARMKPFGDGPLANVFVTGDLALEKNDRIDMEAWAGRVQVGYVFTMPWSPTLTYGYQTFSGDDPSTTRLERFDPLYYEGSPSAWSTGSKSSMVFINSNIHAHLYALKMTPTPRDIVTLRYARISANELLSPIQFGQATRVEEIDGILNPISGVTSPRLSDDVFVEYTRVITRRIYLTAGVSYSQPGPGIDSIIVGMKAPKWTGGFVNIVADF